MWSVSHAPSAGWKRKKDNMSRESVYFTRLDGDWLSDEKIRKLRRKDGYEGLGVYLALLTLVPRYNNYAYEIPFSDIEIIAEEDVHIPSVRLAEIINDCVEIGLFTVDNSVSRFYSSRRKNELIKGEETRKKQRKAAFETNKKLGRLTDKSNVSV